MSLSMVGAISYSNAAADETVTQVIAPTHAGILVFNFTCYNPDATDAAFVQFFDALAVDVTMGSTLPKLILPLPALGGIDGGLTCPREFRTAVTYAVTATATGSGAPSTDCLVQFDYVSS
jgi:hypothetical protein